MNLWSNPQLYHAAPNRPQISAISLANWFGLPVPAAPLSRHSQLPPTYYRLTTQLPDIDAVLRRQIHLVAFLDAKRLVEPRLILHGAVGAELARRMRVGLEQHDLLLL